MKIIHYQHASTNHEMNHENILLAHRAQLSDWNGIVMVSFSRMLFPAKKSKKEARVRHALLGLAGLQLDWMPATDKECAIKNDHVLYIYMYRCKSWVSLLSYLIPI